MTTTLMTPREAAAELRISLSTLQRLARDGRLPVVTTSPHRRGIRQTSIDRYIDKHEKFAGAKRRAS
jgi:excisionase family DNA binding protein